MNKPFLKWAGGKYRVLPHLLPFIGTPKHYCEPFGGSFSVALNVNASQYTINDINNDLIHLYQYLINDSEFIDDCEKVFNGGYNEELYYQYRDIFNSTTDLRHKSILFVYLNRHCFNGLTRYNKKGKFNVPFGQYKTIYFPRQEMQNFKDYFLSKSLIRLTSYSFEDKFLYENLGVGDVVYFDPPYIPVSDTAYFTDYATEGFTHEQQVELCTLAESLANRGVKVILSNHDVPIARELYKNAEIHSIQVKRSISAKTSSRKDINELIAIWHPQT